MPRIFIIDKLILYNVHNVIWDGYCLPARFKQIVGNILVMRLQVPVSKYICTMSKVEDEEALRLRYTALAYAKTVIRFNGHSCETRTVFIGPR